MNLNQLVYFAALAKTGSYTAAADECNVAEPVVYRSVKGLEKACGIRLLERQGKRICLTKAGRAIYEHGAQIATLGSLAEQALAEEKGVTAGHICIGCGTPAGSYLLPNILAKWMSEHPRVTLSIMYGQAQQMLELVLEDRVDFIIAAETKLAPGLRKQLIFSDSLILVSAPGHRLAKLRSVPLSQVSNENLILPLRGSALRAEIDRIECEYGVHFRLAVEVGRQDMIKQLCRAGVGIGVVTRSVVVDELANNQLSLLDAEGFPRNIRYFLVHKIGKGLSAEMRSLIAAAHLWVRETHLRRA